MKQRFRDRVAYGVLGAAFLLGACTRIEYQRGYLADPAMLSAVAAGVDNRESVEKMLGHPSAASMFSDDTWYYVTQRSEQFAFLTPEPVMHLVTAVKFDAKGNVASVAEYDINDIVDVTPRVEKTKTTGKDVGFLAELFGNIGRFGAAPPGGAGGGPGGP